MFRVQNICVFDFTKEVYETIQYIWVIIIFTFIVGKKIVQRHVYDTFLIPFT